MTDSDQMDSPEHSDAAQHSDAERGDNEHRDADSLGGSDRDTEAESVPATGASTASIGRRGSVIAAVVAAGVIVVDQTTKALALDRLTLGKPVPVIGTLEWELVYNRGSAFGLGRGLGVGPVIAMFALVVAGAMVVLAAKTSKPTHAAVYGLVAGGALGNVLDRLFRAGSCPGQPCDGFLGGAVIDFIDLNWWPVFNVADMAIVCGVIAIAAGSILAGRA